MSKLTMKRLGLVLMPFGFLLAAYFTVQHADRVDWPWWLGTTAITVVGAVLLRLSQRVTAEDSAAMADDIGVIDQSLDTLVERVAKMNVEKSEDNVFTYCTRIDDECMDAINDFVEAREAMIHRYGLTTYAKMMDNFAMAERSLNRAWCASADGYIDELHHCIERAETFMRAAQQVVKDAMASEPS